MKGPMNRLGSALVVLYMAAAAAYGGWRGPDVWSGWGVWCFLIVPVAWVVVVALIEWRRNPMGWTSAKIALVLGGFGAVALGAVALGTAWLMAVITGVLSSEPVVRAVLGAGIWIAVSALIRLTAKSPTGAAPPEPEAPSEVEI